MRQSEPANDELYNKNCFLITHNGFSINKSVSKTINELSETIDYLKNNQEKIMRDQYVEPKHFKVINKYRPLLLTWANTTYDPTSTVWFIGKFINNMVHYLEIFERKKPQYTNPIKVAYWDQTRRVHDAKYKKIVEQSQKKEEKEENASSARLSHTQISIDDGTDDFDDIRCVNPHFSEVVSQLSQNMQFYVFLPTLLKVKLLGMNNIDSDDQSPSAILEIQLKVKIPYSCSNEMFEILRYLTIQVKSDKFQKFSQNILFASTPYDVENQGFSVWRDLCSYYSFIDNWRNEKYSDVSEKMELYNSSQGEIIIYRAVVTAPVNSNSYDFHSPFDVLDISGLISVKPIYTNLNVWDESLKQFFATKLNGLDPCIVIKFNLVDVPNEDNIGTQIFCDNNIQDGDYTLAQSLLKLETSESDESGYELANYLTGWRWKEQKKAEDENEKEIKMYKGETFAHFHFPFYRDPVNSLIAIFVTNIVLGIVMFFVFFQDPTQLADVIANIAALLISFVGMIAILQEQLKRSKLSITSILVYLMILTPLLCLIDEMYLFFNPQVEPSPLTSPLFWICVAITALNLVYPCAMLVIFLCCLQPKYTKVQADQNTSLIPSAKELAEVKKNFISKNYQINKKTLLISAFQSNQIINFNMKLKKFCELIYFKEISKSFKEIERLGNIYPKINEYLTGERKELIENLSSGKIQLGGKLGGIGGVSIQTTQRTYGSSSREVQQRKANYVFANQKAEQYSRQNLPTISQQANPNYIYSQPVQYVEAPIISQQVNPNSYSQPVQYVQAPTISQPTNNNYTYSQPVQQLRGSGVYIPNNPQSSYISTVQPSPNKIVQYQQVKVIERVPMKDEKGNIFQRQVERIQKVPIERYQPSEYYNQQGRHRSYRANSLSTIREQQNNR